MFTTEANICKSDISTQERQPVIIKKKKIRKGAHCPICSRWLINVDKLKNHLLTHSTVRSFKCSICGALFRQSDVLKGHIKIHTNEKPYKCSMCPKGFKTFSELKQHSNSHIPMDERKIHECVHCGKKFTSNYKLLRHMNTNHAENNQRTHVCGLCNKALKTSDSLKAHIKGHTKEKNNHLPCKLYGKKLTNLSNLKRHIYDRHNKRIKVVLQKGISVQSQSMSCPQCGLGPFKNTTALSQHLTIHSNEPTNQCSFCGVEFKNLDEHIRKTHKTTQDSISGNISDVLPLPKINNYPCTICVQEFDHPKKLTFHIREIHEDKKCTKPFKCNFCDAIFTARNSLKVHILTHTGEKPYSCQICQNRFITKGNLKVHMRVHTIDRSFQCSSCPSSFVAESYLRRHVETVHLKIKTYSCKFCNKAFACSSSMGRHIRAIHTGDRPFKCRHCEEKFSSTSERGI